MKNYDKFTFSHPNALPLFETGREGEEQTPRSRE